MTMFLETNLESCEQVRFAYDIITASGHDDSFYIQVQDEVPCVSTLALVDYWSLKYIR